MNYELEFKKRLNAVFVFWELGVGEWGVVRKLNSLQLLQWSSDVFTLCLYDKSFKFDGLGESRSVALSLLFCLLLSFFSPSVFTTAL